MPKIPVIVDLMRNGIGRVAIAVSVKIFELFVKWGASAYTSGRLAITAQLPETVTRQRSRLRAQLSGGSITGAPEVRAMEIIDGLGHPATCQCTVRLKHYVFGALRRQRWIYLKLLLSAITITDKFSAGGGISTIQRGRAELSGNF